MNQREQREGRVKAEGLVRADGDEQKAENPGQH